MSHFIVCSAEFKAEYRQQVFPLEKHSTFHSVTEIDRMVERGLGSDLVDAGSQNQFKILQITIVSGRTIWVGSRNMSHIRVAIGK